MTARAARFGAVLAALHAAHDLGDHVVQTDHQAAHKSSDWRAMGSHITGYQITQAVALAALRPLGVRPSWRRTLAGMAVSAATHAFLDRRWPVVWLLEHTGSREFAHPVVESIGTQIDVGTVESLATLPLHGPYLADQSLHHVCLMAVAWILAK
jgi:hypothetical protein